jgi:GT2 family glycosyltransferase
VPFTAARARNAGFEKLLAADPDTEFVQFVDGDCEVAAGWLELAVKTLEERPDAAVACGRRRERFPDASIYNRLCDIEWDTPVGEALACGGDAMMRVAAFRKVGGFDPGVIAGEEPELCVRLRRGGWRVYRLGAEMTLHDAAMTRFGQWWKRAVRTGHAYVQGRAMHGRSPDRHYVRECRRLWALGFAVPLVAVAASWPTDGLSLLLGLIYPLQVARIYRRARRRPLPAKHALAFAASCVLSKFPEWLGACKFRIRRLLGGPATIIEYKVVPR